MVSSCRAVVEKDADGGFGGRGAERRWFRADDNGIGGKQHETRGGKRKYRQKKRILDIANFQTKKKLCPAQRKN